VGVVYRIQAVAEVVKEGSFTSCHYKILKERNENSYIIIMTRDDIKMAASVLPEWTVFDVSVMYRIVLKAGCNCTYHKLSHLLTSHFARTL
jgi:hypothetical protein